MGEPEEVEEVPVEAPTPAKKKAGGGFADKMRKAFGIRKAPGEEKAGEPGEGIKEGEKGEPGQGGEADAP